jgi:hypothetical protein
LIRPAGSATRAWRTDYIGQVRDAKALSLRGRLTTRRGFAAICEIEFGLDSRPIERLAVLGDCDSISVTRVNA